MVEQPFTFSGFPGRYATPLMGAAVALVVGAAGQAGVSGARVLPVAVVGVGGLLLVTTGMWMATRGILDMPLLRESGVNLQATRGGATPGIWLSAHLDSKSQPVPTLARSAGIVVEAFGFAMTLVLAVAAAAGAVAHAFFWQFAAAMTLVGAVPVVLSMVGSRSPGALDNASGVVTVLEAARALAARDDVGILLTDAEELGLAGARAWSRSRPPGIVLNCDGVDDGGEIQVMFTGKHPVVLLDAAARASAATGVRHDAGRLVPGLLTDSVAFAAAGLRSVTFSRGTFWSLARVHSTRDDLGRLDGTGIAPTAALIAATAQDLGDHH